MWFHTKKIRRQVCLEPDLYVATRCHAFRSSCDVALASPIGAKWLTATIFHDSHLVPKSCVWRKIETQVCSLVERRKRFYATASIQTWRGVTWPLGHVLFFLCFSSLFFHQTYAGGRKKNKMPKEKKHWLSVPDYLTDKGHTELVLSAVILLFISLPNNDRVKPVATKVWLSLYLTSLRGQRTCSNLQPKRSSTLRMHSSCRDRSLDGKLDRGLDSRPNTYPDVFVKARPHYYQQSLRSMISTERILAFGFQWPDSVTRLLPPNSRKRALRFSKLWRMCMNGKHHAF